MRFTVGIEQNGILSKIGWIEGEHYSDACFSYAEAYRSQPDAAAISLSLPLAEESFNAERTRRFFEGMLPEGFTRRTLAQQLRIDENDYLSILHTLGRECLGAVRIYTDDEPVGESYQRIDEQEIAHLAAEGVTKSIEMIAKAHLSLAGASGKVGLYYDEGTSAWYLPQGTAPSTHIVKQSHIRLDGIVVNERLSMLTASKCGIDTADAFIINVGQALDSEILFATKRYDRIMTEKSALIHGLRRPFRLHQEDFSQALGIPSVRKYETAGEQYLPKLFELLRSYSSDPIADQIKLWDRLIFQYLIGNTDAHIKNYALLYSADMKSVRLAPAYDILSTVIYESGTRELSVGIGGERSIDRVSGESFMRAAQEAGIGVRLAKRRLEMLCSQFEAALLEAADELYNQGFFTAKELCERIRREAFFLKV